MNVEPRVDDIAVVHTKSGRKFVAVYTLATGIDYYWRPVIPGTDSNQLTDPVTSYSIIGKATTVFF